MKRTNSNGGKKIVRKDSFAENASVKKTDGKEIVKKISPKKNLAKESIHPENNHSFPVVGIGASAGGLDAFKRLLKAIPENSGMAYVLVQHLDPTHESLLTDILQKVTSIPVLEISDNIQIVPDHIYIIPSNKLLIANDGRLELSPRIVKKNERHLPIDVFFTSLSEVHQAHSIGVILSGTATDGTMGLKAIKDHGGITFAQDEASAAYDGMPGNAVKAGVVDFILPPEKIPEKILEITNITRSNGGNGETIPKADEDVFKQMLSVIRIRRGTDFSYYKQTTIHRRILRRMAMNKIEKPDAYLKLLRENTKELDVLYQDLLIPVTSFFRDNKSFDNLCETVFPNIIKNKTPSDPIRIWIAGCSTGEEAYSIAICLNEYLGETTDKVQIFATDINEAAIVKARAGVYKKNELEGISPRRLSEFFVKSDGGYQLKRSVRDLCIFAVHNFLKDPPFVKMDLITCRNVLIYFEPYLQKKSLTAFHYALNPRGFLLLGKSETSSSVPELFEQIDRHDKIYSRKNVPGKFMQVTTQRAEQQLQYVNAAEAKTDIIRNDFQKTADDIMLRQYTPASVVVNEEMDILQFRGKTNEYLEQPSGKPTSNLIKMAKYGLGFELRNILHKAKKSKKPVSKENIPMHGNQPGQAGDGLRNVTIEAIPLPNTIEPYYLVLFHETTETGNRKMQPDSNRVSSLKSGGRDRKSKGKLSKSDLLLNDSDHHIKQLEQELAQTREDNRAIAEDQEATNEELQSANEELLSSSEELQSMNEELESSKEELQSTNEELMVLNQELASTNEQLTTTRSFSESIVNTIREPLLVLDKNLRIKTANNAFYKTFQVNEAETEGALIYELGNGQWNISALRKLLEDVLPHSKQFNDCEVRHQFLGIGTKTMLLNGRELKTKTGEEKLILLAIEDISEHRWVKESAERFRLLIENAFDIIEILSKEGVIVYESESISKILGYSPNERVGKNIFSDPIIHPDDIEGKRAAFQKAIDDPQETIRAEFRLKHKDGGYRDIEAVYLNLLSNLRIEGIVATYHDITERKRVEKQKEEFISIASHELKTPVTSLKAYTQILEDIFIKAKDKKSADLLDKMNKQVDRLTSLITDLLDFTRIQGEKLKLREENYNINELISEVVEEMQRTTKIHKIIIKLDKSVQMWGDRDRTGQVLNNLLSNAIKYSPHAKKIVVSSKIDRNLITVCVEDFGIGIKKDLQNKVFERFFRVSESKLNTFPGLGLGLYIAAEIIKRQNGTINVKSTEGKGSTFCFSLPMKQYEKG